MSRIQRARFCVVAFDADGDMELTGIALGPSVNRDTVNPIANRINEKGEKQNANITTLVVPIVPTHTGIKQTISHILRYH